MANQMATIDPLGRIIYLLPDIFFIQNPENDIYDDATTVIKKPAMIIEINEKNQTEFYYFRSVGWNKTFLIIVRSNNNRWEAYNRINNPSEELISTILKKGKQIF